MSEMTHRRAAAQRGTVPANAFPAPRHGGRQCDRWPCVGHSRSWSEPPGTRSSRSCSDR